MSCYGIFRGPTGPAGPTGPTGPTGPAGAANGGYTFGAIIIIATNPSYLQVGGPQANSVANIRNNTILATGTIQRLYIVHNTPAGAATLTYTVFINGVATALLVAVNTGVATGNNLVNTVAVTQGDLVGIQVANPAAANQTVNVTACFQLV